MHPKVWLSIFLLAVSTWGLPLRPAADTKPPEMAPDTEVGMASFYGARFHRLRTASGERFDMRRLTAAHRTLPFCTRVRVTNLRNGRSAVVHINDRGPFVKGRVIDLSLAAARQLRMVQRGAERVRVEVLSSAVADQRPSLSSG
jgi:rare lipoprotein A